MGRVLGVERAGPLLGVVGEISWTPLGVEAGDTEGWWAANT